MKAVLQPIRILVIILYVKNVCCQDGFSDRDLLRLQQIAANDGQIETITSYNTNIIQRDPTSQSMSSVSVQYHMTDDPEKNEDYSERSGRSRKVFRIKNPFQRQLEDDGQQQASNTGPQDSDAGASNQYASMQYSLPPDEFLQQMRAENQYYQQQQQVSTQAPNIGYTATPQSQYQYSTIAASGYDNSNLPSNQIPQLEPKMSSVQNYRSIPNSYQYNGPNSYLESGQSTPSPISPYLSTSLPNNQFIGTPSNAYVSSSSPIYLSSSPNLQQYISSSISALQAGTPDYNNKVTSTVGSNALNYENNDQNKKMQIDHYDNSAIGVRYPVNVQQQYQNEYPTSTAAPLSTPYPEQSRDSWQNDMNVAPNSISKSLQETQYQNYLYNRNQDGKSDSISENSNSDTHRIGNMPSANNVYLNFARPDYQAISNLRTRTRDVEHETGQPDFFSHGEYGWKLNERKPSASQSSGYSSDNYPRYQALNSQPENVAVSQMTFHMDNIKPHNYNQISKSSPENDAQEFARAAAKAQENLKRQQIYENYAINYNANNQLSSATHSNNYYNNDEKQRNKIYSDSSSANPYLYSNSQHDLITASPYYYANSRENTLDEKSKQPFDHDKALKNIVPIDVSNVVSNSENQQKAAAGSDNTNRYSLQNIKDQVDQNVKQNVRTITDSYYQDKNAIYAFNIKPKPETSPEGFKLLDSSSGYYNKQPPQDHLYNQITLSDNKRYTDGSSQSVNHIPQVSNNYQDNIQSSANIQQQGMQRTQPQHPSDITSILKLNDIPHRLTQNMPAETFRQFNNNNYEQNVGLPTPLPVRINQNLGSHQLDVATDILNKLILNKQQNYNMNRPEIDPQSGGLISTINGFRVANPFNVDLKLVADMLRGKPAIDDSHMINLRDQYTRPAPLKLDLSHIQQLLANNVNQAQINDGLGAYSSPYLDIYNSGRYPYQGVKYSRSQEEEESIIPIADSSNNHPIGAVIEQDDIVNGHEVTSGTDLTAQDDDNLTDTKEYKEDRPKHSFNPGHRGMGDRHKHPNSLLPGRHSFQRKYPKSGVAEPYPLLKPPPPQSLRGRGPYNKKEKHTRRRRVRRPKVVRLLKTEPLFEAESDDEERDGPTSMLLRPPLPIAEAKSDVVNNDQSS